MEGVETIPWEDFNLPTDERKTLLDRLQEAMGGDVPIYFWAACQICDIQSVEKLIQVACISPPMAFMIAAQTRTMVNYCK
jgi:hypothetical protein